MSTFSAKPADVKHEWFVIDATDKVLGRIASEAALRLRGKHKAIYTPHVDTGDFIVVINASKIRVTGNKALDKVYYRHSGYPGGIYGTNFRDMQAKHPGRALEKAVKGMLPKGPLGYAMIKKLKVYGGTEHPHSAQQPKPLFPARGQGVWPACRGSLCHKYRRDSPNGGSTPYPGLCCP